jgi:hypothetical protein
MRQRVRDRYEAVLIESRFREKENVTESERGERERNGRRK